MLCKIMRNKYRELFLNSLQSCPQHRSGSWCSLLSYLLSVRPKVYILFRLQCKTYVRALILQLKLVWFSYSLFPCDTSLVRLLINSYIMVHDPHWVLGPLNWSPCIILALSHSAMISERYKHEWSTYLVWLIVFSIWCTSELVISGLRKLSNHGFVHCYCTCMIKDWHWLKIQWKTTLIPHERARSTEQFNILITTLFANAL